MPTVQEQLAAVLHSDAERSSINATRILLLDTSVAQKAVEVMGDNSTAARWLASTTIRSLGGASPLATVSTPEGHERILALLEAIREGVYE